LIIDHSLIFYKNKTTQMVCKCAPNTQYGESP
jgi:hypothetical protein